jgi:hypothetical protein
VATIIRNLSFEIDNMEYMSANLPIFRYSVDAISYLFHTSTIFASIILF